MHERVTKCVYEREREERLEEEREKKQIQILNVGTSAFSRETVVAAKQPIIKYNFVVYMCN